MNRIALLFTFILFLGISCKNNSAKKTVETKQINPSKMIYLTNKQIKVGIRTDLGGRVMSLQLCGKENILISDTSVRIKVPKTPQEIEDFQFQTINGQIVWLGSQNDWWAQQDIAPKHKAEHAGWPPDPFLAFGEYKIVEQNENFLKIISPESPVSNLQLTKEIRLEGNKVIFRVCGRNCGNREVSWDLWLNMRLDGWANGYVPVKKENIRFKGETSQENDLTNYETAEDIFNFCPEKPSAGKKQRTRKAFIYPTANWIAGFDKGQVVILRAKIYPKEAMHPEQAPVEIYSAVRETSILELEYHSAYKTMKPNETIVAEQSWELLEYKGKKERKAHIEFLKNLN